MSFFGKIKKALSAEPSPYEYPLSPRPLRGWTNLGMYEVHGVNPKTGRSNKKMLEALDEAGAMSAALAAGLVEPISVCEVQRPMATERQIAYGASLGLKFTGCETMVDASAMICMVNDGESGVDHVSPEQWREACLNGVCISALSCQRLFRSVMKNAGGGLS